MSFQKTVEAHHKLAYTTNCALVLQQKTSKFAMAVTPADASGEAMSVADLVHDVDARHTDGSQDRNNPEMRGKNSRRWAIRPNAVDVGVHIDKEEMFDQINDPTSKVVQGFSMAMLRAKDDLILGVRKVEKGVYQIGTGGILGSALEGKRPGANRTDIPAEFRTVHGSARLTLDKLIGAREKLALDENDFDDMEIFMAHSPKETTDLLNIAASVSGNLNAFEQRQLESGKITSLMGFNFIETNRLPVVNGARYCPLWTRNNIIAAYWQDIEARLWNDSSQKDLPYVYQDLFVDVVRAEDAGVHIIETQVT